MKREIDARGQLCPRPVIMTKKILDEVPSGIITTIVDNEVAKENVSKLANSLNYSYEIEKTADNHYYIRITKGEASEEAEVCIPDTLKDMTIVFGCDKMGRDAEELGKVLMKGFIYTLTESIPYPSTLVFLNSGVKLTTEGSDSLDDLMKLQAAGVEIISCGTCLDYFHLKDKLKVGEISNMYTILEKMKNASSTITL